MKIFISFFLLVASSLFACPTSSAQLDTAYIYTYGGSNNDYARQIICTSDSGYIVVGTTGSFGIALTDIYIVKTDRNAVRQWSRIYGTAAIEWGYSIKQTYDDGYIITGFTNQNSASGYDIYLLKIDLLGNVQWTKTIGGPDWDFAYGIELTVDSGFVICGKSYSYSNGGSDVYLIRTDSTGAVIWQKNYGGNLDESASAIIRDRNNNYAIIGETKSYGLGDADVWALKIDGAGDTLWTNTYGTTLFDAGYAIDTTSDGSYVCNGTTYGRHPGDTTSDMYLFKIDALGNQLWLRMQGDTSSADEGRVVQELPDGNIFSGGMTESFGNGQTAYYMLRCDNAGYYLAGCAFGGTDFEDGYSVAVGKDNQIVFAGISDSYGCGLYDVYLIRIDTFSFVNEYLLDSVAFCDSTIGIVETSYGSDKFSVYPNPVTSGCFIDVTNSGSASATYKIRICDITGKEIYSHEVSRFPYEITNDIKMESGVYLISVYKDDFLEATHKIVVL